MALCGRRCFVSRLPRLLHQRLPIGSVIRHQDISVRGIDSIVGPITSIQKREHNDHLSVPAPPPHCCRLTMPVSILFQARTQSCIRRLREILLRMDRFGSRMTIKEPIRQPVTPLTSIGHHWSFCLIIFFNQATLSGESSSTC